MFAEAMAGLVRLSPGAVFAGDFEIVRYIAEGGMGSIYEARDRVSGEVCALKLLLPELVTDEKSRERFNQEARVATQIDSPNVPRVIRSGVDPDTGAPFIAMELLVGRTLRDFVAERGPIPIAEARPIFEAVTHALAAAHRMNLVHRDLKPENVFLHEPPGQPARVKLLDFGVSKIIALHKTSGLGTGAVGSPMWMAPEQTSAGGRIAPATDVWALGLLTFYVLTGKLYWKAARETTGVAGLLREIHVDPIMLPSRRVRELGGPHVDLPRAYDDWFNRAMRRDGSDRYREAGEAMEALRAALTPDRPADRSVMAYASTVAFDSPVSSGTGTQPLGGAPAAADDDDAAETQRYLPRVEVPETSRSLPAVDGVPETARSLPRVDDEMPHTRPSLPRVEGPGAEHVAPTSSAASARPSPAPAQPGFAPASHSTPGAPAGPGGEDARGGISPAAFVLLLLVGGCVVSVGAAGLVWFVLRVIAA